MASTCDLVNLLLQCMSLGDGWCMKLSVSGKNRSITGPTCDPALPRGSIHSTDRSAWRESADRGCLTDGHWSWGTQEPDTGPLKRRLFELLNNNMADRECTPTFMDSIIWAPRENIQHIHRAYWKCVKIGAKYWRHDGSKKLWGHNHYWSRLNETKSLQSS